MAVPDGGMMRPLAGHMADYGAQHRDRRTKLTHFIGVPLIVLSLLVLLSLGRLAVGGMQLNLAVVFVAAMLAGYLWLDAAIGLMLAVLVAPLLALAAALARQSLPVALAAFVVLFVSGWALQLIGHRFEGNRPAFLDNLLHMLVAPAFLTAELLFALGLKRGLREEIERRMAAVDPVRRR